MAQTQGNTAAQVTDTPRHTHSSAAVRWRRPVSAGPLWAGCLNTASPLVLTVSETEAIDLSFFQVHVPVTGKSFSKISFCPQVSSCASLQSIPVAREMQHQGPCCTLQFLAKTLH